jgi:hypothetical protein
LALRVGPVGLGWETGSGLVHGLGEAALLLRGLGSVSARTTARVHPRNVLARHALGATSRCVSAGNKQPTQNWHGPGESDCLIKTKHCAAPCGLRRNVISAQCSECQSEEIHPSAGKRRE